VHDLQPKAITIGRDPEIRLGSGNTFRPDFLAIFGDGRALFVECKLTESEASKRSMNESPMVFSSAGAAIERMSASCSAAILTYAASPIARLLAVESTMSVKAIVSVSGKWFSPVSTA